MTPPTNPEKLLGWSKHTLSRLVKEVSYALDAGHKTFKFNEWTFETEVVKTFLEKQKIKLNRSD